MPYFRGIVPLRFADCWPDVVNGEIRKDELLRRIENMDQKFLRNKVNQDGKNAYMVLLDQPKIDLEIFSVVIKRGALENLSHNHNGTSKRMPTHPHKHTDKKRDYTYVIIFLGFLFFIIAYFSISFFNFSLFESAFAIVFLFFFVVFVFFKIKN